MNEKYYILECERISILKKASQQQPEEYSKTFHMSV